MNAPSPSRSRLRRHSLPVLAFLLLYALPVTVSWLKHPGGQAHADAWRTGRQDSAGIAPAVPTGQAGIQAWCARVVRWRGAFGVHCWIAAKPVGHDTWTRFEVIGWQVRQGGQAVRVAPGIPDAHWFGERPTLIRELRGGAEVDALIGRLHAASRDYPHNREYRMWPGPNSNTYIAYLGRAVPELSLDLPPTAIGKDYLPGGAVFGRPASGTGVQFSLAGLFGLVLSPQEGLELNVLGLTAGLDVWPPALKLPGIGRVGLPSEPAVGLARAAR